MSRVYIDHKAGRVEYSLYHLNHILSHFCVLSWNDVWQEE